MADLNAIAENLGSLTILEAGQLVKMLEEKWGVSAAVAAAAPAGAVATGAQTAAPVAAQTEFTVILASFEAAKKIGVIKEVRAITGLGLKEAKDLVEGAPKPLKEGVSKDDAEKFKKQLTDAGAVVELK